MWIRFILVLFVLVVCSVSDCATDIATASSQINKFNRPIPKEVGDDDPRFGAVYSPLQYGAACDGSAIDTKAFQALITALGSTPAKIKMPGGRQCRIGNLTIPATITIDYTDCGAFKGMTGTTLFYLAGTQAVPGQQIFYNYTAAQATVSLSGNKSTTTVYPGWWGAKGDGTTDDTASLSAMFNSALSVSATFEGLNLSYVLSSAIIKTVASNVNWTLKDFTFKTSTIAEPVSEVGAICFVGDLVISGGAWIGTDFLSMSNVTFVDNRTTTKAFLDGISVMGFARLSMTNVKITGYSNTGALVELSRNVNITNCEMSNNLYAGLRIDNVDTVVVTGGNFDSNGTVVPTFGYGIALSAGDQVNSSKNILIQGATANRNKRKGLDFHAGINIKVIGNSIVGFGLIGIYATSDVGGDITRNVQIISNLVEGDSILTTGGAGIAVGANGVNAPFAGQIVVANNIVKNTNTARTCAIEVDAQSTVNTADTVIITGNTIKEGASSTSPILWVNGVNLILPKILISNNVLQSTNGAYGIKIDNATVTTIDNNQIEIDAGTVTAGISVVDSPSRPVMISNNYLFGAATYSSTITDFVAAPQATTRNNRYLNTMLKDVYPAGRVIDFGNAIPIASDGWYARGSVRFNVNASSGGPSGWICTVSGTPGTWAPMANVP